MDFPQNVAGARTYPFERARKPRVITMITTCQRHRAGRIRLASAHRAREG
jgi:hypothetical protein